MKPIQLRVQTKSNNYQIIIGSNLITKLSTIFKKNSLNFKKCLLVVDRNISKKISLKIKKSLGNKDIHIFNFNAS